MLEDRRLDLLRRVLALELVLDLRRGVESSAVRGADRGEDRLVDGARLERFLLFADLRGELTLKLTDLLDRGVRDVERVEDLGLGDLVRPRLDHQDRVLGTGDDQIKL